MLARNSNARNAAIIVGGAPSVDGEVGKALSLCWQSETEPVFFVTNDKITTFGQIDHAVTLHPSKLPGWLQDRAENGLSYPGAIWAFRLFDEYPQVTNATGHWQGSSGLFAIKIARELGFERIILCGVPMTASAGHFLRHEEWKQCTGLRQRWIPHIRELKPYVRSWSGWTGQIFGSPDEKDWLRMATTIKMLA